MSSLAPASGNSQSAIIINAVRPIITIATKLSAYVASNQEQKVPSRTTPKVRISLIFVDKSLHPQLPQKLFLQSYNIFCEQFNKQDLFSRHQSRCSASYRSSAHITLFACIFKRPYSMHTLPIIPHNKIT